MHDWETYGKQVLTEREDNVRHFELSNTIVSRSNCGFQIYEITSWSKQLGYAIVRLGISHW